MTHYVTPNGSIYPKRVYEVMNPVTAQGFTGDWTPPVKDIDVLQAGANQDSSSAVLFAIELKKDDRPDLLVSDVAAGTFTNLIHLDANLFGLGNGPHLAQYTSANKAVLALSPDGGAVGGSAPLNVSIDLATGETHQFGGYNLGEFHAGYVNGLAVDPNTGIAATTTELNSQVEFYDMDKMRGITAVQLPCTDNTDQVNSGSGIAVDPVHKLFLVTDQFYCDGNEGSAIVVYDEKGNLVETITGSISPSANRRQCSIRPSAWAGPSAAPAASASCSSSSTKGRIFGGSHPALLACRRRHHRLPRQRGERRDAQDDRHDGVGGGYCMQRKRVRGSHDHRVRRARRPHHQCQRIGNGGDITGVYVLANGTAVGYVRKSGGQLRFLRPAGRAPTSRQREGRNGRFHAGCERRRLLRRRRWNGERLPAAGLGQVLRGRGRHRRQGQRRGQLLRHAPHLARLPARPRRPHRQFRRARRGDEERKRNLRDRPCLRRHRRRLRR